MSAPTCRLYLVAPDPLPADFPAMLAAAVTAGDIAALQLAATEAETVARVVPITRAHGVALILDGPPTMAASSGCDGAHLRDADRTGQARRELGDLPLGVFCGTSRDAAMRAGEAGADYVAFGPFTADTEWDTAAIAWWADLMELPVVAEGAITAANCAVLVRAGADFLAVGDAVWDDPQGPAEAVRALAAAIAAA